MSHSQPTVVISQQQNKTPLLAQQNSVEWKDPQDRVLHSKSHQGSTSWSWNDSSQTESYEYLLLNKSGVAYKKAKVPVLNDSEWINTIHVPNSDQSKPTLVLLHGFGSGMGFWCANLPYFSSNYNLYMIDLPGFGASSRPRLGITCQDDAEEYFLKNLEDWRLQVGLTDKFILSGHSFGGYISSLYAMKYPQHLLHLSLIDPWGLVGIPPEYNSANVPLKFKIARWVAEKSPGPLSAFRFFGKNAAPALIAHFRRDLLSKFASYGDAETITNYIYSLNSAYPTGEMCFSQFTEGLAWSKRPLAQRLLDAQLDNHQLRISFLFGENTWMSKNAGRQLTSLLPNVVYDEVPNAGHHLYIENPTEFASRYHSLVSNNH